MKSSSLLFSATLVMGTMLTVSSPSWFTAWMGLEMNLLSFVPLILNNSTSNSAVKYFFIQAMGSMMIMFSMITPMLMINMSNIIIAAIILKLGGAPLHFWLPQTLSEMSSFISATLLSWQKMAPLALLTLTPTSPIIMAFMITSAMMGAWGGINEMSMKTIMAYASINHMAWMLALSQASMPATFFYLAVYTLMVYSMFLALNNTNHLTQMWADTRSKLLLLFSISILSLGGLPPLTGFIPKWMAMNNLMQFSKPTTLFLVITSMLILYYYVRIIWISSSQSQLTHTFMPQLNMNFWLIMVTVTSTLPVFTGWLI